MPSTFQLLTTACALSVLLISPCANAESGGEIAQKDSMPVLIGASQAAPQRPASISTTYLSELTAHIKNILRIPSPAHPENIPQRYDFASAWRREMADQSSAGARPHKEIDRYKREARQGFAQSQYKLAMMYLDGGEIRRDASQGYYWFKQAALQGHAQAQLALARLFEQGDGVARDYQEALTWYLFAAEQGVVAAQQRLGTLYERGLGTPVDKEQAQLWYERSANARNAQGQYNLGLLHAEMGHVSDAYVWLALAERNGLQEARNARHRTEKSMTAQQISQGSVAAQRWNAKSSTLRLLAPRVLQGPDFILFDAEREIHGKITLSLMVDQQGKVIAALTPVSTGVENFDKAARKVAQRYTFAPARQNGKSIAGQKAITITYSTRMPATPIQLNPI